MKGCRNTFIFACIMVSVISLSIGMCSCKGKEVKPGVYLDSVYSPAEAPLRIKNDSIIIKQPGISHAEWIYPLGNGDTLRYGYAGIQKAGDFEIRKRIVKFGVDNNGIHRLMTTYEKDTVDNYNQSW